ncbi:head-tail adaptor protein [Zhengella mangrovi]|uniref:Head-tail adaptor protein n=1 Tax=Zhengella mangrovi TaxID=1982044 RepID=A0A2G1QS78_9HYPH|nr:phage head closure protein [Zhengella mangrovi]PHP68355.1 head-tail adaptor protein [Zhengella mangrovi]
MPVLFVDPGRFRTYLVLEAPDLEPDGEGGLTGGWSETAGIYALVEPVSAARRFAGDRFVEETTHRVTLRHRAGVLPGMRFRCRERLFAIRTVHDPDETGRYLVCLAVEEQR